MRWVWLAHLTWVTVAAAIAIASAWSSIPSFLRWVLLGLIVYTLVAIPVVFVPMLRAVWNAPQAERANSELKPLERDDSHRS